MMTSVNFSNCNSEFLKGLNTAVSMVRELADSEQTLKDSTKAYNAEHLVVTKEDKKARSEFLKSYRNDVKAIKSRLDGYTTLLFGKFTPLDNFTDIYSLDILEFLKNIDIAEKDCTTDNIKDSALRKVGSLYNAVRNRVKPEVVKRKKGDAFLTFIESKEIADTSAEVVLAFFEGFKYTGAFIENESGMLELKY